MADPMEKIAEAIDAASRLGRIESAVAQLTAVVQANLGEQQRLNQRFDSQASQLGSAMADTRERLVKVESLACEVPGIKADLANLSTAVARYVGVGAGAAVVVSTVITVAVKLWG